jgi:hypothetical protein
VPESHPLFKKDYSECLHGCRDYCYEHSPDALLSVHGGLTYAAFCQESDDESTGICHVPEPGQPAHVWWFGFDCAHCYDVAPGYDWSHGGDREYRDLDYVRGQVRSLAAQLAALPAAS